MMTVREPAPLALLEKYNVPGPRYTSYPTVPFWDQRPPTASEWDGALHTAYKKYGQDGISLYIHLPYCESLCTYCGCTTRITVNHAVEEPYIAAVLSEWSLYQAKFNEKPLLRELHLGGGTPTFFSPGNLVRLVQGILATVQLHPEAELSFEAHPANTTSKHLKALYRVGFRRLSLGIQDFDPKVQLLINRKQSFDQVANIVHEARHLGFTSINMDLLYGLPAQTATTLQQTLTKVSQLAPDRVAFYGYAHIPWIKPAQKSLEAYLPDPEQRFALFSQGKDWLLASGYEEIGMDHFALPNDALAQAARDGHLHRNFMGYTLQPTKLLLGLGASAISDIWHGFSQNSKAVEPYMEQVAHGKLPTSRGHQHSAEDLILRQHILNLMCHGETHWVRKLDSAERSALVDAFPRLEVLAEDGLIDWMPEGIRVTPIGKPFIRNICMALDARLWRERPETKLFSQTI